MNRTSLRRSIAVLILALGIAACTSTVPLVDAGTLPPVESAYRLGANDKLRISVFGEDRLTGDYAIAGDGMLAFPLIGEIKADGLTNEELGAALTTALANGFINTPRVAVQVTSFRPFFIFGEVERPGRYPTAEGTTISRAISTAGGYTYRANRIEVFIQPPGKTGEVRLLVKPDFPIRPGDVIRVGERYF
jgi:protein involved in polysaccharide export with SLBB domain